MLQPEDRSILIDDLRPPTGYQLAGAVATTFTLDLTTAVIPTLAFSSIALATTTPDPVSALEAVRLAAEKVDVFCQAGSITIPARASALLAFVEPMVHGVRRPKGGLFHPKVWFVKYVDDVGSPSYRLLVLTRNLTNDRSWDIAVRFDSQGVATKPLQVNDPLSRFLYDLPGRTVSAMPRARRERVKALAAEAKSVVWGLPEGADGLCFHYLPDPGFDTTGARHLIVSPFLNEPGLDQLVGETPQTIVVSRPEALEQLSVDRLGNLQTYVLPAVPDLEAQEDSDESVEKSQPFGLHAKLYVVEPHGRAHRARLIIGSANATDAALTTNAEFMVEFQGPRRAFGVDVFMGQGGSLTNLVEAYSPEGGQPPEPDEDERRELDNCLRSIAEIRHTVEVKPSRGEAFELTVTADKPYPLRPGWSASVELLTRPGIARNQKVGQRLQVAFPGVGKADITPFVCIRVTTDEGLAAGAVVLAQLINDPSDRLDVVLASQIDTREKFLRFVHLLLSLGSPQLMAEAAQGDGLASDWTFGRGSAGLLELALRALVHRPQAIDDLDRLVERMEATATGAALLPEGFAEVWAQVRVAGKKVAR